MENKYIKIFENMLNIYKLAYPSWLDWESIDETPEKYEGHRCDYILKRYSNNEMFKCAIELTGINDGNMEGFLKQQRADGLNAVWSDNPLRRIGKCIDKSSGQLRNVTEGKYPSIIVIYDNTTIGPSHLYPEDIFHAMYGPLEFTISFDKESHEEIESGWRIAPKGRLLITKEGEMQRTHISGIATLKICEGINLNFFENFYVDSNLELQYPFGVLFDRSFKADTLDNGDVSADLWKEFSFGERSPLGIALLKRAENIKSKNIENK